MVAAATRSADRTWSSVLGPLVAGQDLPREGTAWAMERLLSGEATPAQQAAFVVALRCKGETVDELAGLADTMLDFATPIEVPGPAVDIVGSGGRPACRARCARAAAPPTRRGRAIARCRRDRPAP